MILNKNILMLFKSDLWKDQRKLEKKKINNELCLIKYFDSDIEFKEELRIIEHLSHILNVAKVPKIFESGKNCIAYSYIKGIRVFNLLVELDELKPSLRNRGSQLKQRILSRCEANQKEIQEALLALPKESHLKIYPAGEKVGTVINILAGTTGIVINWDSLRPELNLLSQVWQEMSNVPFRDATTKNMVLAAPELWLGNFDGEESRRAFLIESLDQQKIPDWFDAPIYDFDFSSCSTASTTEDDPISLRYHERSWIGPPQSAKDLIWHGNPDNFRAACSFIVRYYRFGGRKAAYRLLHPWGHRIRFRHDNDLFYFSRLPSLVQKLSEKAFKDFHEILSFSETLYRTMEGSRQNVDLFMAAGLAERRRYYVDMYPE